MVSLVSGRHSTATFPHNTQPLFYNDTWWERSTPYHMSHIHNLPDIECHINRFDTVDDILC